ncbi:MAG: hypothetical protein ACNYVW_06185, partial [Methanosarcinales archaeon]
MQTMNSDKSDKKRVVTLFACIVMTLVFLSAGCASAAATPPEEAWSKTFGGTNPDWAEAVQQTADGGYILVGTTQYTADNTNVWLLKTYSNGTRQWDQTFGGPLQDWGYSVQQTSDNGYIIAGKTFSYDQHGHGLFDVWLFKTNSDGEGLWGQTFGGSDGDWAYSVQQTKDNGFIVAGGTHSFSAGFWADAWLVKTYFNGEVQWEQTFGGTDSSDVAYAVQQTSDGDYIIAGYTKSYGAVSKDAWLLKTNSDGDESWNK